MKKSEHSALRNALAPYAERMKAFGLRFFAIAGAGLILLDIINGLFGDSITFATRSL